MIQVQGDALDARKEERPSCRIDRRSLLQTALLLAGAHATGLPGVGLAQVVGSGKGFFHPAQYAVLENVVECIIPRTDTPGARDAGVAVHFDAMMHTWATEARRGAFRLILDEIDQAAQSKNDVGFVALPADQQLAVMAAYDEAKAADPEYLQFKTLILALYYMSEPGATQELRYEHTPGVWEPSVKVAADARAWAVGGGVT
jgi:gluconate 2-dehydrogenase gamma chain